MHIIIYMKNREKQSSIPDEKTVYELSDFFQKLWRINATKNRTSFDGGRVMCRRFSRRG